MNPPLFDFTEMLEKRGYDPSTCRLVRHDRLGAAKFHTDRALFASWICFQSAVPTSYNRARHAFHFIPDRPGPDGQPTGLFVGGTEIGPSWVHDRTRLPAFWTPDPDYAPQLGEAAFDLSWCADTEDLVERVVIDWGRASRAWSQWADKQRKPLLELRRDAREPSFPGFANFSTTLEDLDLLPGSWRGALTHVTGVYLLVCPETGALYVGAAYGAEGFLGRWSAYRGDGHGGNVLLRAHVRRHGRVNYAISVLEIASPTMSREDILARESEWKRKLGARAHGLNAN